jgi:polyisoprenoid-binding protein YceI
VTGDLTLLGTTKPITFDVEYSGQSAGSDTQVELIARATINRHDFGLGQSMKLQSAAGKTATIEMALVAVQNSVRVPETITNIA